MEERPGAALRSARGVGDGRWDDELAEAIRRETAPDGFIPAPSILSHRERRRESPGSGVPAAARDGIDYNRWEGICKQRIKKSGRWAVGSRKWSLVRYSE